MDQVVVAEQLDGLDAAIQQHAVAQRLLRQTSDVIRHCEEVLRCTSALAAAELRSGSTSGPPTASTCASGALPRVATTDGEPAAAQERAEQPRPTFAEMVEMSARARRSN